MKQMMFAKEFPKTHPRAGQPTHFVEKIWSALAANELDMGHINIQSYEPSIRAFRAGPAKYHTIRGGNRWKVGDVFIPKIWFGAPYRSKTITFAPPITILMTWDIIQYPLHWTIGGKEVMAGLMIRLAMNDGLSSVDFMDWFPPSAKAWEGQIICWNSNVNY